MLSYIKEIQKRNINTGRGSEWERVSGCGTGRGQRPVDVKRGSGNDRRNVRQSEGIEHTSNR